MGSRGDRARKGLPQNLRTETVTVERSPFDGLKVPKLDNADVVFGNIRHLPPYDAIPKRFRDSYDPYARFVSEWFFRGRTPDDMKRLTERLGVDRNQALRAIKAVLGSFEPKHEHKEAGCAFMLHEWFELT